MDNCVANWHWRDKVDVEMAYRSKLEQLPRFPLDKQKAMWSRKAIEIVEPMPQPAGALCFRMRGEQRNLSHYFQQQISTESTQ